MKVSVKVQTNDLDSWAPGNKVTTACLIKQSVILQLTLHVSNIKSIFLRLHSTKLAVVYWLRGAKMEILDVTNRPYR